MTRIDYVLIFIVGTMFGSFLNAYLWRVRAGRSVWKGRSMCTYCKNKINWFDNIPIISFFILRAKCRSCKKPIFWQYPSVELWMGLAFVFIAAHYPLVIDHWSLIITRWFIIWFLTLIFLYDLKYQEILNRFTLIPAGILFLIKIVFSLQSPVFFIALDMLLGAFIASGFFLLQFTISKGKWIGGGDVRLGVFMGVILGWKLTILALLIAYILGAVVGIILLILAKKKQDSQIAFGTFLSVATLIAMFWGEGILGWYLGLVM
ncbi:MAG: prepilin peptidase [Patescibacteria group bacterium]